MNNICSRVKDLCPGVILRASQIPAVTLLDATHTVFCTSSVCGNLRIHMLHKRRFPGDVYILPDGRGGTNLGVWREL